MGHMEAGLRSHDIYNPFPEESNRRLTSQLTEVHLTPTPLARQELLKEEEAPTLQKPLLVLRELTERPEAFQAGLSKVVGTSREAIVAEASRLLSDDAAYRATALGANPYGDGRAAERIAEALCRWSRGQHPLLESAQEFQPIINTGRRELGMEYAH